MSKYYMYKSLVKLTLETQQNRIYVFAVLT